MPESRERETLSQANARAENRQRRGTYLPEPQWGTVREDSSTDGNSWSYLTYEKSRYQAYRWGEDGLLGGVHHQTLGQRDRFVLLDLTAAALVESPDLARFSGRVSDSGEGRWTTIAAIDEGVPADVLSTALFARFTSQGSVTYADKLVSAMSFEFGGHEEKKG